MKSPIPRLVIGGFDAETNTAHVGLTPTFASYAKHEQRARIPFGAECAITYDEPGDTRIDAKSIENRVNARFRAFIAAEQDRLRNAV